MASMKIHGQIRINSIQTGTTKWREGSFEIVEKDNKASLVVLFNSGGPAKTFQLSHNVKVVKISPSMKQYSRLLLTLQDKSSLIIDKAPSTEALVLKDYLESLNHAGIKSHQGSGNFGGKLGNRIMSKDSHQQRLNIENQTPTRRDETPTRKTLNSPGRATLQHGAKTPQSSSSPGNRMGTALTPTSHTLPRSEKRKRMLTPDLELTEDYPKENDSSSNNKVTGDPSRKFLNSCREKQLNLKQAEESRSSGTMPLQCFYGSRASSKDYSAGNSFLDRSSLSGQSPSAKRNLGFLPQPSPQSVKKLRANQDYTGWNRPRVPHAAQLPQQLQGFSNLGNTCYMNAILQSLFSLQSLATDLLKQGIPWKKIPANALLKRFAHLLIKKDNCSPEVKKELLKRVKNAISTTAERFSGYVQNDAHEFLSQCLDQLKEDMEKLNKTWKNEPVAGEDSPAARGCHEAIAARVFTCPIVSNVEFEVLHTIGCKTCCESVTKREQFNDLSIDLPRRKKLLPPRSIQDSLDLFFRVCSSFFTLHSFIFNNSIGDLMGSDEDSGNEEILDMDYSEAEAEELKRNAETGELAHSYRLISVVSHIGSSSSSGHYISDVYDIKKQTWLTYNDLEVSKTMEGTVQSDRDKSGYIFFYMHKEILEELAEEEEKCSQPMGLDSSRPVLQPL
ncbi:ubiquitin carboxyl-terminal hydrolase 37 [Rhincodon typus]|uniref:ubiquitin carboxyl-terminal hydrolase 37 n=1 Tax=Rhincodon typus TaxID=259920 RepID=UPI00202E91F7|nr:ubiquitin carboxyl-terminal hydrolase 37 [Rhincodon typus]